MRRVDGLHASRRLRSRELRHGRYAGGGGAEIINPGARQEIANRLDLEAHRLGRRAAACREAPYLEAECLRCARLVRIPTFLRRGKKLRSPEWHYAPCGLPCGPKDVYYSNQGEIHGRKKTGEPGLGSCPRCGPITDEVLERLRRLGILQAMKERGL